MDAYEAVALALSYRGGWETLAGNITDQASGTAIAGAVIRVKNRPWHTISSANGSYSLNMPADTVFDIVVENPASYSPIFDRQLVSEDETSTVDYILATKVPVILKASFANPQDISYRTFYFKGSWDNDGKYEARWSGDFIEAKDDGVWPDEVAGDGIVTGLVNLFVDLSNLYSWAIFLENYGRLDDARLGNGDEFMIGSFTSYETYP